VNRNVKSLDLPSSSVERAKRGIVSRLWVLLITRGLVLLSDWEELEEARGRRLQTVKDHFHDLIIWCEIKWSKQQRIGHELWRDSGSGYWWSVHFSFVLTETYSQPGKKAPQQYEQILKTNTKRSSQTVEYILHYLAIRPDCLFSTVQSAGLGEGTSPPTSPRSSLSSLWLRSEEKLRLDGVARCSVLL